MPRPNAPARLPAPWRRRVSAIGPVALALVPLMLALHDAPESRRPEFTRPIRGITISTHTSGGDWASDAMRPTMLDLQTLGADWVAIHPYARIEADGSVRFRAIDPANPPAHVVRPIRLAHELGLKILIKPHLAYWGSPFDWRGAIRFDDDDAWQRFFRDYGRWIAALAAVSAEADGFVVGTELDATLDHERRWREIIERVRQRTTAPLTYAANWTDFRRVPFWDALDAIGIQAYFPLTETHDPSRAELRRAWQIRTAELREFSRDQDRPILFTELGYARAHTAAARPWESRVDGDEARALQERCLRVALDAVQAEPTLLGVFLWKWFPEPRPLGRNFQLASPGMRDVIAGSWTATKPDPARTTAD